MIRVTLVRLGELGDWWFSGLKLSVSPLAIDFLPRDTAARYVWLGFSLMLPGVALDLGVHAASLGSEPVGI